MDERGLDRLTSETVELLQTMIRNECVNDGHAQSGEEVRNADVNCSDWDSSLERGGDGVPALRLGLRQIKGLSETAAQAVVTGRDAGSYRSIQQLVERSRINGRELGALAAAGALSALDGHRHKVRWTVEGVEEPTALFASMDRYEATPMLRRPTCSATAFR